MLSDQKALCDPFGVSCQRNSLHTVFAENCVLTMEMGHFEDKMMQITEERSTFKQ